MRRYFAHRLIASLITVIGTTVVVFMAIRLVPGDQITAQLGTEAGMLSDEQRAALERYYGLDKPAIEQYFTWLGEALTGNLGVSIRQGRDVLPLILDRFPVTVELAVFAIIIALSIGLPIGILSAIYRNTWIDVFGRVFSMLGLSVPNFLLGTLIIYGLSVYFGILPNSGDFVDFTEDPIKNLGQIIFPAITMGFSFASSVMRMTRSAMLEILNADFVRTARSKGLPESVVVIRHALRNAWIPVITLIGVEFGYLLGGAFIVEQLFSLPGIGRLTINAISQREYALVQGVTLFIVINFVLINLLVDLLYGLVDPRVSYGND